MDGAILGVLIGNTGLLVWIGYRLGSLTKVVNYLERESGKMAKTTNFLERNCPLLKGASSFSNTEKK